MNRLRNAKGILPTPHSVTRSGTAYSTPAIAEDKFLQELNAVQPISKREMEAYEEIKMSQEFRNRDKESYARAMNIPYHHRDQFEKNETDMSLPHLWRPGALPVPVKDFIESRVEVPTSDVLLTLFWQWYSKQGKEIKVLPQGWDYELLPIEPIRLHTINNKIVNYWKELRREETVTQTMLKRLDNAPAPDKISPQTWKVFIKRFKKCFEEDSSKKKTFKTISALYLTKYDSQKDLELYVYCKKLLSKAANVWICREAKNERKRDKKASDKQNQLAQENQIITEITAINTESISYTPQRMFSVHEGRDEKSIKLRFKPSGKRPRSAKEWMSFPLIQETCNFKKWISHIPDQHEHDYDSDFFQVEQGKRIMQEELRTAIMQLKQDTRHLTDGAHINILHAHIQAVADGETADRRVLCHQVSSQESTDTVSQDIRILRQEDLEEGNLRSTISAGVAGAAPNSIIQRKRYQPRTQ